MFAIMAVWALSSCSKDDDNLAEITPFTGEWQVNEVTDTKWLFNDESYMYIVVNDYVNYQMGYYYQAIKKPYSIVFRAYSFDEIDRPVSIVLAQYDVQEITGTSMKLKCSYLAPQSETQMIGNPFIAYPSSLTLTK